MVFSAATAHSTSAGQKWNSSQRSSGRQIALALARPRSRFRMPASVTAEGPAIRMVIPKIHVDSPVVQTPPVQGVWLVADWSVGHLTTTPNPGAPGNGAYAAHDDIKGEIFKRESELVPGDKIYLYTVHAVYTYVVARQMVVDPSNVSPLNPTASPTITLISCLPYWVDTQRLIVQAIEQSRTAR